ncbi:squalene--hopene cyclase [Bacillus sp. FJAT-42376]|uniref:terpene cyclase/mutase family protein n=1 Tax=Bacillus sp. FJAT-42376 TaxID=2014076 RepID=UPI000F4D45CD|nr:prenyltransferase/squalene oxidase repeat-containing protein [Bacillus sp. FJAT-42376]AZB42751.1 squalene--hopene cyclase [Bacillus sp. FJAT-42376]
MKREAEKELLYLTEKLKKEQLPNGSWSYMFETGIKTDCFMIVLLKALQLDKPDLIKRLAARIASRQDRGGSWRLFHDQEEGDLSTTIEAYYALLLAGIYKEASPQMQAAKRYMIEKGGIKRAGLFTRIMLTLTSQDEWPSFFSVPIEAILLPKHFPVNMYDLSIYGRANLIPILTASAKRFRVVIPNAPDLTGLYGARSEPPDYERSEEWRGLYGFLMSGVQSMTGGTPRLREAALKKAENYILHRLESDGTLYSYFSCTFLMIFALMAIGYDRNHPVIQKAVSGLISMAAPASEGLHMQYTTAHVWNTSLLSYALQEAGIKDGMVGKANQYIISRQHHLYGDWVIHNPDANPGGWGFSDINTLNPDIDDTSASLRAIHAEAQIHPERREAWNRGLQWLLSMQNGDGGWASFERNASPPYVHFVPIEKAEFIISDASSADLTGRTIEFLCGFAKLNPENSAIQKGIRWLLKHQESNGSWNSRWGICYIYGTWSAMTGLSAAGYSEDSEVIRRSKKWLEQIQNPDGGWGESCKSDLYNQYVPLGTSTLTQTAWAVDALLSCSRKVTPAIHKGIRYLIEHMRKSDWTSDYPKGQGFAGQFYIHYHSYDLVYPMLALSAYLKKANDQPHA